MRVKHAYNYHLGEATPSATHVVCAIDLLAHVLAIRTDRDKKRQHTTKRTSKGKGGNEARKHRLSTTRVNKMTTRWGGMEKQNSNEIRSELSV